MVISIRTFFSLFLMACLYWSSARGEGEAVGRLDSMTEVVVDSDMGVSEVRESITLPSPAGRGAGDFEVDGDADDDSGPAGTPRLPDRLAYRGMQAVIAAEYMYRL